MSEEPEEEKMSESAKVMLAVVGAIVIGFVLVGLSKQQTNEEKESAAMVRNYYNLVTMASDICPKEIKKQTGAQVYSNSGSESDKESYITLKWEGDSIDKGAFKKATCRVESAKGGISELIIDDKVIIKR
jgi:hypothetical protein